MSDELRPFRAEFARVEEEEAFRAWSLNDTVDQARIAVIVTPVLFFVGFLGNLATLGVARALVWALPVRLGFLLLGIYVFWRLGRDIEVKKLNLYLTGFQVILFLSAFYFVWISSFSPTEHMLGILAIVLAVYLFFPSPLITMVTLGAFGSLGFEAVGLAFLQPTGTQVVLAAEALLVANGFGAMTAYRLHTTKRREYMRLMEAERLNRELETANIELERLATTDSLTGINNRRHFLSLAKDEMARARRYHHPMSVLLIDVDHFKKVNDTYGHAMGDRVLRELAATCVRTVRETDIVGRLGGEEFAVMLPETGDGTEQAERLRTALADLRVPVNPGASDITVTVSIGVAQARPWDHSVESVLSRADEALYTAKAAGRNQVVIAGSPDSSKPDTEEAESEHPRTGSEG